jgi:ABC-type antimicrobial peptide transport system permease subunit
LTVITQSPLAREAAVRALRASVQTVDPDLPIFNVRTLGEYLWRLNVGVRILSALLGAFAAFALVVSMVGVYSLTAYTVRQRTHEIGVRMALGAAGHSIVWLFARRGIIQLTIGLVVGMAGAWAVSRIIISQVMAGLAYHVSPTDAVTFVAVPFVLTAVTLAACMLPAGKAAKGDPAAALRHR